MTITTILAVCIASLFGIAVGMVLTALVIKSNGKKDDTRYEDMVEHQRLVEFRLQHQADNTYRMAEALEGLALHFASTKEKV